MAELQPPLGLERLTSHTMLTLRQSLGAWAGVTGVLGATDLQVTETPTPSMQVRVAKGQVIIPNTLSPDDGPYHAVNDAAVDLDVAASDPTNARIDLVVARVYDGFYAGADDEWKLEVVTGTPSGDPVEPATPDNAQVVGRLEVGASAGSVTNADITDVRANAKLRARLLHGVDLDGWEATEPGHLMTKGQVDDAIAAAQEPLDVAEVTSGTAATLTLTVPTGVGVARLVGRARSDVAQLRQDLQIIPNNASSSGAYRDWKVVWAMNADTPTATFLSAASVWRIEGGCAAATATSGRFGSFEATIQPCGMTGEKQLMWSSAVEPSGASAEARLGEGRGRRTSMGAITSIVVGLQGGGNFVAGTRVELHAG